MDALGNTYTDKEHTAALHNMTTFLKLPYTQTEVTHCEVSIVKQYLTTDCCIYCCMITLAKVSCACLYCVGMHGPYCVSMHNVQTT